MSSTEKQPRKRRYVERPDVRILLLDAAEALVQEEGYGAATARRIASRAGLKHQVVFYYFGTQDDLLLALFQRQSEAYREKLKAALSSEHPLSGMWAVNSDPVTTKSMLEFMALSNHNDAVRAEMARHTDAVRELEVQGITRHLKERGIEPRLSPELVSILCNGVARLLVQEATLGFHRGHEEAQTLIEQSFRNFEASGQTATAMEPIVSAMSKG